MQKENYEIITREELVKHIKKNKLDVKYYFRTYEFDIEECYERLNVWISSPPELISGAKLYFDFDASIDNDDEWFEFSKMLNELKYGDLIIIRNLQEGFGAIDGFEILEFLSKLLNFRVELYILDYENEQLIKVDIRQLLIYILEALRDDNGRPEFKDEMIEEISSKYYDGKLC